jgi:hypothetical protein
MPSDTLPWIALAITVIGWAATYVTQRAILRETRKHALSDRQILTFREKSAALQRLITNTHQLSHAVRKLQITFDIGELRSLPLNELSKSQLSLMEDLSSADLHFAMAYFPVAEATAIIQQHTDLVLALGALLARIRRGRLTKAILKRASREALRISTGLGHLAVTIASRQAQIESDLLAPGQ